MFVLDTEAELVIVLLGTSVTDVRGVTLQHAELEADSVTDIDPHPDGVAVA